MQISLSRYHTYNTYTQIIINKTGLADGLQDVHVLERVCCIADTFEMKTFLFFILSVTLATTLAVSLDDNTSDGATLADDTDGLTRK